MSLGHSLGHIQGQEFQLVRCRALRAVFQDAPEPILRVSFSLMPDHTVPFVLLIELACILMVPLMRRKMIFDFFF
jgi:hypothetical protein